MEFSLIVSHWPYGGVGIVSSAHLCAIVELEMWMDCMKLWQEHYI